MGLMLAFALTSLADVQGAIDKICLPYTAPGGTPEASEKVARAEQFAFERREGDALIFRKGDMQLALGTILGDRFCQLEIPGDVRTKLTGPAEAVARARGFARDIAEAPDLRWNSPAGSVYLSLESDDAPVTTLSFIGREGT